MNPRPVPGTLVPPRPNLGPESYPVGRPAIGSAWPLGLGLAAAVVAWRLRARRRRAPIIRVAPAEAGPDPTPKARLIAASESIRSALIGSFGPRWASMTTEEVAADPGLVARLGPDRAAGLVDFLRLADRAKFADREPEEIDEILARAVTFEEEIKS